MHYMVLVVGDDYKKALHPFDELGNLKDFQMKTDKRAVFEDRTDEFRKEYEGGGTNKWSPEKYEDIPIDMVKGFKTTPFTFVDKCMSFDTPLELGDRVGLRYRNNDNEKFKIVYGEVIKKDPVPHSEIIKRIEDDKKILENLIRVHKTMDGIAKWVASLNENRVTVKWIAPPSKVPHTDKYKTFEKFCDEWHGATEERGRFGFWSNPNGHWDWYEKGGRYAGRLRMKVDLPKSKVLRLTGEVEGFSKAEIEKLVRFKKDTPSKFERVVRAYGDKSNDIRKVVDDIISSESEDTPGTFSWDAYEKTNECFKGRQFDLNQKPNFSWGWDQDEKSKKWKQDVLSQPLTDRARKCDIDWDVMNNDEESARNAEMTWDLHVEGREPVTDEEKAFMKENHLFYKTSWYLERYKTKENYVNCSKRFKAYVVVTKDGQWLEKYENELDWDLNFYERFIKPLDDNEIITIVDCHN